MKEYPWLKLWSSKWLYGSGRIMTAEKRGVWIDLLALANEVKFRDGSLRFEVGRPMTREYITNILQLDRETLDACLAAFQGDINTDNGQPRVIIWEDGTIFLTNFLKFQEKGEKTKAKESAIERGKVTKRRTEAAVEAMIVLCNRLNAQLDNNRYTITDDGRILDGTTGEIKTMQDLEAKETIIRRKIK